ncbi:hypothetical protein F5B20DRAFT_596131 [Whalleya microplaca]|nr:hypothetical protein F5B20DRAFT_596131 [Whalleya microplaca]
MDLPIHEHWLKKECTKRIPTLRKTENDDTEFFLFRHLPTELRWKIWECALLAETERRMVPQMLSSYEIMPTPRLVSSLMEVNRESRKKAKKFYSTRLPVYRYTRPRRNGGTRYTGRGKGTLYLNLERDTIVCGFNTAENVLEYSEEEKAEALIYPNNIPRTHITREMTTDERDQIKRAYMILRNPRDDHHHPWCCWTCHLPDAAFIMGPTAESTSGLVYPNCWFRRAICYYGRDSPLFNDLASLNPDDWLRKWRHKLVDVPPSGRRLVNAERDEWVPDEDPSEEQ